MEMGRSNPGSRAQDAERRAAGDGDGKIQPRLTGPGCRAARRGLRAGDHPGGGAARSRSGAETGGGWVYPTRAYGPGMQSGGLVGPELVLMCCAKKKI